MVPFIWSPKYVDSYHAIHKTWGRRCDVLKFMIDPIVGDKETGFLDLRSSNGTNYKLPEDVVVISDMERPWNTCDNADGNCRNIWEKIWRAWKWVDANGDSDLAEWFVKIDADSYLFPENMKRYVVEKGWSPDEHHYFGHVLRHKDDTTGPLVAGAAVFFSRATLKALAGVFRTFERKDESQNSWKRMKCQDVHTETEEILTSWCLKEHFGVDADPALDSEGQELVTVGEIEDVLKWNRTEMGEWWYWQNKPMKHPVTGKDNMHYCCGDLPIAFHGYKDSQWFFKLEREFYSEVSSDKGDGWKGNMDKGDGWKYKWRNPAETNEYFDRVRKAMKQAAATSL